MLWHIECMTRPRQSLDTALFAQHIADLATEEREYKAVIEPVNTFANLSNLKGSEAHPFDLMPERPSEITQKAVIAQWFENR